MGRNETALVTKEVKGKPTACNVCKDGIAFQECNKMWDKIKKKGGRRGTTLIDDMKDEGLYKGRKGTHRLESNGGTRSEPRSWTCRKIDDCERLNLDREMVWLLSRYAAINTSEDEFMSYSRTYGLSRSGRGYDTTVTPTQNVSYIFDTV